ncbi:helix-turn-helix transcriptional regulator [bacterium]|nr:helix-turn-helix transcriptional regulator [bacterium]
MRHSDIWAALDALAARNGLTPSALARRAGLDPTAFNRSKRFGPDGDKPRWPSTESVAKAIAAVGASFDDFAGLMAGAERRTAPLVGLAQAGSEGYFDDAGFPAGSGWDEVRFPGLGGAAVYALEISGDSMAPLYRPGDRIIVQPAAEGFRRGDRVVVRTRDGEVLAKEIGRIDAREIDLVSLNPTYPTRTLKRSQVAWIARILWASQ